MAKALLLPQEVETFYLLPAIRRHLAAALRSKMKQKEVASILGVNSAAISQYSSTKRGNKIKLPASFIAEIKKSATHIFSQWDYVQQTQRLLALARQKGVLCAIHHQISAIPLNCQAKNCFSS